MSSHEPHPGAKTTGQAIIPAAGLAQLEDLVPFAADRVVPHTLFDSPSARVVHIALDTGQSLTEHMAPFPIIVSVVAGSVTFEVNGERHVLVAGGLIHLEEKLLHAVHAITPARINITLLKSAH